jgi:hypothetical protein
MSSRDKYALELGKALASTFDDHNFDSLDHWADTAYQMADALLAHTHEQTKDLRIH